MERAFLEVSPTVPEEQATLLSMVPEQPNEYEETPCFANDALVDHELPTSFRSETGQNPSDIVVARERYMRWTFAYLQGETERRPVPEYGDDILSIKRAISEWADEERQLKGAELQRVRELQILLNPTLRKEFEISNMAMRKTHEERKRGFEVGVDEIIRLQNKRSAWIGRAACRDLNPDAFFFKKIKSTNKDIKKRHNERLREKVAAAQAICRGCPVLEQCSEYGDALDHKGIGRVVVIAGRVYNMDSGRPLKSAPETTA